MADFDLASAQPVTQFDLASAPPVGSTSAPPAAAAPQVSSPGLSMSDVLQKIALGGRAAAEGVVGAFATPHDLNVLMMNAERSGINRILGTNLQPEPTFTQKFSQALTDAGAYTPETKGEQYGTAITRGVAGGLTGAGVLGSVTPAVSTVPN